MNHRENEAAADAGEAAIEGATCRQRKSEAVSKRAVECVLHGG